VIHQPTPTSPVLTPRYTGKLSKAGYAGFAGWLGSVTVMTLLLETFLKVALFHDLKDKRKWSSDKAGGGTLDRRELFNQMAFGALGEMVIFLLEDTTTISIWYFNEDTFDSSDAFTLANLYLTIISGFIVGFSILYCWKEFYPLLSDDQRVFKVFGSCMVVAMEGSIAFWSYVTLDIVLGNSGDLDDRSSSNLSNGNLSNLSNLSALANESDARGFGLGAVAGGPGLIDGTVVFMYLLGWTTVIAGFAFLVFGNWEVY
jgi:hypothetical protein